MKYNKFNILFKKKKPLINNKILDFNTLNILWFYKILTLYSYKTLLFYR